MLGNQNGTFSDELNFEAPAQAVSAVDVDRDGKVDIVAPAGNKVAILIGDGDGTFIQNHSYTVGATPSSIAIFDENLDTHLDVAVTDSGASSVSILTGSGDGVFNSKIDYQTGPIPVSIASADMDGDGIVDLAIANSGSNTISVLQGNTDGTFRAKVDYPAGENPSSIISIDVNGDTKPDLVISNLGDTDPDTGAVSNSSVSVLVNRGDGSFATRTDYATSILPTQVLAADVNNDGHADLIVPSPHDGTVSILAGNGDGTFEAATSRLIHSTGAIISIAMADVSNDGNVDLVVTSDDSRVTVLKGDGHGIFRPRHQLCTWLQRQPFAHQRRRR